MKKRFIKASNYALGVLLVSIGFSSCKGGGSGGMSMYGTPTADYEISGKVTDLNNNPIEGINVSHPFSFTPPGEQKGVITDTDGNYKLNVRAFPGTLELKIEDIDGVENGEYQTKEIKELFENSDYTEGDGSWYEGKTTRTVNIKLTEETTPKD